MKTLVNHLLIVLLFVGCTSNEKQTKETPIKDLQVILKSINNKDSLSLQKEINKSNVNSFDTSGVNILSRAVMTGDLNLVKILGENGANPNLKNKTSMGSTPLMMASEYKSLGIAKYLLKKGADIDIQDNNGDPAIHWSAYYGNVPFTRFMLENGAKTNLKSIHSDGVMQVALKEWKDSVVDLLLEYKVNIYNVQENSKDLINAVKNNNYSLFRGLVNKNNINTRDGSGNTLLMIAAQKGFIKIVEYLVDEGVDIDEVNSVGQTALNLAVYFGQNSIANYLIEKGANVNKTDNRFILSPLIAAIRSNNLEIGKILLMKGADVNSADGINNFSPIMWATLYQNKDFIILLLKYFPDLSIVSKYKQNVFEMTNDKEILKLLRGN